MSSAATPWRVELLGRRHDRDAFSCGTPALDRYLREQARQDAERFAAAAFITTVPPSTRVLGYYTLSASIVGVADLPAVLARRLPRYPQLPVTLLGRLAVDERFKGRGLGQFLLMDALHRSLAAASEIAAMAVVVDAIDEAATAFYRRFGFESLQRQPRRMFIAMTSVAALF